MRKVLLIDARFPRRDAFEMVLLALREKARAAKWVRSIWLGGFLDVNFMHATTLYIHDQNAIHSIILCVSTLVRITRFTTSSMYFLLSSDVSSLYFCASLS